MLFHQISNSSGGILKCAVGKHLCCLLIWLLNQSEHLLAGHLECPTTDCLDPEVVLPEEFSVEVAPSLLGLLLLFLLLSFFSF